MAGTPAVSLVTVHRPQDLADADADLACRFGDGQWAGWSSRPLFGEVLAPVVAPGLLAAVDDWRALPVIALAGPRPGWRDWAAATGRPAPASPHWRFDTFDHAASACVDGAGVMLGSLALIDAELADGRLQRLDEPALPLTRGYWWCWRPERADRALLDVLAGLS